MRAPAALVIVTVFTTSVASARSAYAEEQRQVRPQAQEIAQALKEVGSQYGPDVSLLGAALLAEAIEAGAIEETAISIAGIVEHESHRYLQIRLETGIVYNEVEVPTDEQGRRLWKVVETCLRRFKSFSVPEEGLAFHLAYKHLSADPPVNFYQAIRDNRASLDVMEMFLPKNSLEQMLAGQQTPQAVLAASVALVNGRPIQIKLEP